MATRVFNGVKGAPPAPAAEVVRGRGSPRITVRLSETEQQWLDEMEAKHGVSAADVVRVGFAMIRGAAANARTSTGAFVASRRST